MLSTVTSAVRAPGAAVLVPGSAAYVAVHGSAAEGVSLPLRVGGREVGVLRVAAPQSG